MKPEHKQRIREWHKRCKILEWQWSDFTEVVGGACDSPLGDAVWRSNEMATEILMELVGDTDRWLEWWQHTCELGATPMVAKAPQWSEPKRIVSIDGLIRLMEACGF